MRKKEKLGSRNFPKTKGRVVVRDIENVFQTADGGPDSISLEALPAKTLKPPFSEQSSHNTAQDRRTGPGKYKTEPEKADIDPPSAPGALTETKSPEQDRTEVQIKQPKAGKNEFAKSDEEKVNKYYRISANKLLQGIDTVEKPAQ